MATASTGKYVQICGRGMRTHNGKENCLLLDYGGNCIRFGPIDMVDPVKRKNIFGTEKKAPPMKECPQCHAIVHARTTVCDCGYSFPVVAPHGTTAYDGAVMSGQVKAETVPIAGVWYSRHKKVGKPDSVKVTFYTKLDKEYYTYLGLDHGGYFAEKSLAIVRRFGGKSTNVTDALKECEHWRKPVAISVKPRGPYYDVVGIAFNDNPAIAAKVSGQVSLPDEVLN
jgi:DNA repair protein RadD